MKVKVLYDFPAQPDSSELNIYQNEILTVINKDIGEGWWEGKNERGERGLFPASYVEPFDEINSQPPPPPPPPPANVYQNFSTASEANQGGFYGNLSAQPMRADTTVQRDSDMFGNTQASSNYYGTTAQQPAPAPETTTQLRHAEEPDWPDEDWDDEDDSGDDGKDYHQSQKGYPIGTPFYPSQPVATSTSGSQFAGNQATPAYPGDLSAAAANLSIAESNKNIAGATSAPAKPRRNFNRFSNFVKTGLESFILDPKTINVPMENIVRIQNDPELGIVWKPNLHPYTCAVTKHGKESKMKGFKTYISYDVTPSTSNIIVRRRYKHFDWLMQRMEEKFIVTPLPPLPEKQIAGRFQEDFVEHRRNLLQLWVNYVTRHPVLSQCDVWWHFMTCSTDDMKGWKFGKRRAEKDELVGANFFFSVEVDSNTESLGTIKTTKQLENFNRFVSKFDDAVKHMYSTAVEQSKKFSTVYAKDYKRLSESIKELSSAFQSGTAWRNSLGLNEAIRQTSSAYEDIGMLHEEEPKNDFEPMADILHQYRGLLSGWPEILQLHKNTVNLRNEHEKLLDEGKITSAEMARVNQRASVITYSTLAEINHFHNERLVDFKQMVQVFLTAQINFHSDILARLQTALNKVNEA